MIRVFSVCLCCLPCVSWSAIEQCSNYHVDNTVSIEPLWHDFTTLSADDMLGRETQTLGAEKARRFIANRYAEIGLQRFSDKPTYDLPFQYQKTFSIISGVNVAGWLSGTVFPNQFIVITAHYDHLGRKGRKIFNGADDNASGVAAMIAIAQHASNNKPRHSVIFVATDAEESGLYGAKAFVRNPPVGLKKIQANVNLDMLSQNKGRSRLYISGHHSHSRFPELIETVKKNANVCIVKGHKIGKAGGSLTNRRHWRDASDHAAFARKDIPFLFLGVSDHAFYHTEKDTSDKVDPTFYQANVEASLQLFKRLDDIDF